MENKQVKIFSTHSYEEAYLNKANTNKQEIFFESASLSIDNTDLTKGFEIISVFTNDDLSSAVLEKLSINGVKYIAIRATGYDHVDLHYTSTHGIKVANVPAYSPYSVAEHAVTLMLSLNRKLLLAEQQVHRFDFTLNNLIGFDMNGKTVGIVGMGKIGGVLAKILNGFGCKLLAYDVHPNQDFVEKYGVEYCSKEVLFSQADIISLHCPLNEDTKYTINKECITQMKTGVMIINCGRGGLLHTEAVLDGLESGKIGYLGLDVYEKEKGLFFFDHSQDEVKDSMLQKLMTLENVIITPHQAFLTSTALKDIAETTFDTINNWSNGVASENEVHLPNVS